METRTITLTLDKAKEWYSSDNEALKKAALQAFTEDELKEFDFKNIKTFEDAVKALQMTPEQKKQLEYTIDFLKILREYSSLASLKLNIIRKALNKGHKMSFTKDDIWYPYNPAVLPNNSYHRDNCEIEVAKVKIGCDIFTLIGGSTANGSSAGLGILYSGSGVVISNAYVGFLGCATKEIAEHLGIYFAKEIFEAKYGDYVEYEWL